MRHTLLIYCLLVLWQDWSLATCPEVTSIDWREASEAGGTEVILFGCGFERSAFQLDSEDESKGNHVFLENGYQREKCTIVEQGEKIIKINTPPLSKGLYNFVLKINGQLVPESSMCGNRQCTLEVKELATINNIYPTFSPPGTVLTLEGRVYTDRFTGNMDAFVVGREQSIRRIYNGAYSCEPQRPFTDEYYGLYRDHKDNGYISCKPSGTYIGNEKLSFIVDPPFGRSRSLMDSVDRNENIFSRQTYAIVNQTSTINPIDGAIMKIHGLYLEADPKSIIIKLGRGRICEAFETTKETISCRIKNTGSEGNAPAIYAGGRGVEVWQWPLASSKSKADLLALDLNAPSANVLVNYTAEAEYGYARMHDVSDYSIKPLDGLHAVIMRGVFRAPKTATYIFRLEGSKTRVLTGTNTVSGAQLFQVDNSEESAQINLTFQDQILLDARSSGTSNGAPNIRLAVRMLETKLSSLESARSVPEIQRMNLQYNARNEKQQLDLSSLSGKTSVGKAEVQRITVKSGLDRLFICVYDACLPSTTLPELAAETLQLRLRDMLGESLVVKELTSSDTQVQFSIQFPEDLGDVPPVTIKDEKLAAIKSDIVSVEELTNGAVSVSGNLRPALQGIPSDTTFTASATLAEAELAVKRVFSHWCPQGLRSPDLETTHYFEDFENTTQRVTNKAAFCGLQSSPFTYYRELPTEADTNRYPMMCFAVSKSFNGYISFLYTAYTDDGTVSLRSTKKSPAAVAEGKDFDYQCHNTKEAAKASAGNTVYKMFLLKGFYMWNINGQPNDFYIDNIFVGTKAPYERTSEVPHYVRHPGLDVNNVLVTSSVAGVFNIEMQSETCASNFHLIGLAGVPVSNNAFSCLANKINLAHWSMRGALSRFNENWPSGTFVMTTRVQAAGVQPSGTYRLKFKDRVTDEIPLGDEAKLTANMHTYFGIDRVTLTQSTNCKKPYMDVQFDSQPGVQPLLTFVDGSRMTGTELVATISSLRSGHLNYNPIPTDTIFVPKTEPQVEVTINGSPSFCSSASSCNFNFDPALTAPSLASVTFAAVPTPRLSISGTNLDFAANSIGRLMITDATDGSMKEEIVVTDSSSLNSLQLPFNLTDLEAGNLNVAYVAGGRGMSNAVSTSFTIDSAALISITPITASLEGGQHLTVNGARFSTNAKVMLGSQECPVISRTKTQITCTIPKASSTGPSNVEVKVAQNSVELTGSTPIIFRFENPVDAPVISSKNVTIIQGIAGGAVVKLIGSNFKNGDKIAFNGKVVDATLRVESSTSANFAAPSVKSPGTYKMQIYRDGAGLSESTHDLEYRFSVTGVTGTSYGSWVGGQRLTISGTGFTESTKVKLVLTKKGVLDTTLENVLLPREALCKVISVTNEAISVRTSAFSKTHLVENKGTHPTHGMGWAWSQPYVRVIQGDIVHWKWTLPSTKPISLGPVSELNGLHITETELNSTASVTGQHSVHFGKTGKYYFAHPEVPEMISVVEVLALPNVVAELEVLDADVAASTYPSAPSTYSFSPIAANCISAPVCESITLNGMMKHAFTMQSCLTPKVNGITALQATAEEEIFVKTESIGNCKVESLLSISDAKIGFKDPGTPGDLYSVTLGDEANSLNYGTANAWFVEHTKFGRSLLQVNTKWPEMKQGHFFLLPSVTAALSGSTCGPLGGCHLHLKGNGFNYLKQQDNVIRIGKALCPIVRLAPGLLVCKVPPLSEAETGKLTITVGGTPAVCSMNPCSVTYDANAVSTVSSISPNPINNCQTITLSGTFKTHTNLTHLQIKFNDVACNVTSATSTQIQCKLESCISRGDIAVSFVDLQNGISNVSIPLKSAATVETVSPSSGSLAGSTKVILQGNGLNAPIKVKFGANEAVVMESSPSGSSVTVLTPAGTANSVAVSLVVDNADAVTTTAEYTYDTAKTPTVTQVNGAKNVNGTRQSSRITVDGSNLSPSGAQPVVKMGTQPCVIVAFTDSQILCDVELLPAGSYVVDLVNPLGKAEGTATLAVALAITSNNKINSGMLGGQPFEVEGTGFAGKDSVVKVCETAATDVKGDAYTLKFSVPASAAEAACDVTIEVNGQTASQAGAVSYTNAATPSVTSINPSSGGSGGGTRVTITGTLFGTSMDTQVFLGTAKCQIESITNTEIVCVTASVPKPAEETVDVVVENVGKAQSAVKFAYIDRWSSVFTWGGTSVPKEGDLVSIPAGKEIMLDSNTPVLSLLLIDGGKLYYDPSKSVTLNARYILVINGGVLEIGTEANPYMQAGGINLHGNFRDPELPLYGSKVLGLRNGTIDIHGRPIDKVWTRLAETSPAGSKQLVLSEDVDWVPGDRIVLASTSVNGSTVENEEHEIATIAADKRTIQLVKPLAYKKHAETVNYPEHGDLTFAGEVGLLTRNIKIKGVLSLNSLNEVPCPAGFTPDTFMTQNCVTAGKDTEMPGYADYGGQIFISAAYANADVLKFRMSNTELTEMGQAFRLGRYPIHFHMNGDMPGTYVNKISIHKAFNRAINVHKSNQVLIEKVVAFNVMGGALFLEDSVEENNVIKDNLFIYVRASNSLLNDDVTPAAYWITNPNNIITGNVAAGGTHFGFWYRMLEHPTGPSTDPNYCPRVKPLGKFDNNVAHSQGWFGLWIHADFYPTSDGACGSRNWAAAVFTNFFAWSNGKGAECVNCGAVSFKNFVVANNREAGLEWHLVKNTNLYQTEVGPNFIDSTVIGKVDVISPPGAACRTNGVVLPWLAGFTIKNIAFHDFNGPGCGALHSATVTCICRSLCGGFLIHSSGIKYFNSDNRGDFRWNSDFTLLDLDGSLSAGINGLAAGPNTFIVTESGHLPLDDCPDQLGPTWAQGQRGGRRCKETATPLRLSWNQAFPGSITNLDTKITLVSTGSSELLKWKKEGVTHAEGWVTTVIQGHTYDVTWVGVDDYTLFGYAAGVQNFRTPQDYIIIRHSNITVKPDRVITLSGTDRRKMLTTPLDPTTSANGDVYWNEDGKYLEYLVKGSDFNGGHGSTSITFQTVRCEFPNCVKPLTMTELKVATTRPDSAILWSDPTIWGPGSIMGAKPGPSDPLIVKPGVWLVLDESMAANFSYVAVYGALEVDSGKAGSPLSIHITTEQMGVVGGRLAAGLSEATPLTNTEFKLTIRANSNLDRFNDVSGPILGPQSIGIYGVLTLFGTPTTKSWTTLSSVTDQTTVVLKEAVDWAVGSNIVVAPTGLNNLEYEVVKISAIAGDGKTLTVTPALQHTHVVYDKTYGTKQVAVGAEVGLLDRNIVIEGPENSASTGEGARLLVSQGLYNGSFYTGMAKLKNVKFHHMGRRSFSGASDPRFAVVFMNLQDMATDEISQSYVDSCVFTYTLNSALGVFDSNKASFKNNLFFHITDQGLKLTGSGHEIENNLLVFNIPTATLLKASKVSLLGFLDTTECTEQPKLAKNHIVGAYHVAFTPLLRSCSEAIQTWTDMVIHTCLVGVMQHVDYVGANCGIISGLTIYSTDKFSIYVISEASIVIQGVNIIDSPGSIYPYVFGPSGRSRTLSSKYVLIKDSLIVGTSGVQPCDISANPDAVSSAKNLQWNAATPYNGNLGLTITNFLSKANMFDSAAVGWTADNALGGKTTIQNCVLARFGEFCPGKKDLFIRPDGKNEDGLRQTYFEGCTRIEMSDDHMVFFPRPSLSNLGSGQCGNMECDALKKVIVTDKDGSLFAQATNVLPDSAWQWDRDARYGIGSAQLPRRMRLTPQQTPVDVDQAFPKKGVIRHSSCTYTSAMQAFKCDGSWEYTAVIVESLDADSLERRIAPIGFATQDLAENFVDLINGPSDHGLCDGYVCNRRLAAYQAVVANGQNFLFYATATMPQHVRIHMPSASDSFKMRLGLDYLSTYRLEVYANGEYVAPLNAQYDAQKRMLLKEPSYKLEFMPNTTDASHGANYYNVEDQVLYVIVEGRKIIDVKISPLIQLSFKLPAMTEDEFFSGDVLGNLAAFLGIPPTRIRVVKIVSESGSQSRRRRAAASGSSLAVQLEISEEPGSIGNGTSNATISTSENIYVKLVDGLQTGAVQRAVGTNLTSISTTPPVPTPSSTTWASFANNIESELSRAVSIPVVESLAVSVDQTAGIYARSSVPISAELRDDSDMHISSIGSTESPWKVRYSLATSPSGGILNLPPETPFNNSDSAWARGSSFTASLPGVYSILAQAVTSDGVVVKTTQVTITVIAAPLKLGFSTQSALDANTNKYSFVYGQTVSLSLHLYDVLNATKVDHPVALPVTWTIVASVCRQSYGAAVSKLSTSAVLRGDSGVPTASVTIDGVRTAGLYSVCFTSTAFSASNSQERAQAGYELQTDASLVFSFLVRNETYTAPGTGFTKRIRVTIAGTYSSISNQVSAFALEVASALSAQVPEANFRDFTVSSGSILADGTMEAGSSEQLDSAYGKLVSVVTDGSANIVYDGQTYQISTVGESSVTVTTADDNAGRTAGIVIGSLLGVAVLAGLIVVPILIYERKTAVKPNATEHHIPSPIKRESIAPEPVRRLSTIEATDLQPARKYSVDLEAIASDVSESMM